MSWFSVPLPNPFKALQFSDDEIEPDPEAQQPPNDAVSPSAGVKDDLSAIGETIGRQLRGVAAFLAPPPADDSAGDGTSQKLAGIRNDLAEIGGSFKTSLSLLSSNRAVSEISKLASNLLQLNEETELGDDDRLNNDNAGDDYEGEDEYEGAGVTDEVIEFAAKISNRPELWTDFPLAFEQEFDLSDAQSEHVSIIEQLVPSMADLRSRLISDITEKQFWLIYFILLLPRLNEDDLELLSTPEIVEARETLLQMLRSKNETEIDSENPQSGDSSNVDNKVTDEEMEKSQSGEKVTKSENSTASRSTEINESNAPNKVVEGTDNKSDPKVGGAERVLGGNLDVGPVKEEHETTDIWLEDGKPATTGSSSAPKRFQSEDDVSFSDLEDDDTDLPNRPAQSTRASSPEGSSEWVQLNKGAGIRGSQSRGQLSSRDRESEGEESSDWLTVDDFDP
uniref:BSD domain-containing protein n=1 Tax=Opuntia streptacantha TaxID=393608 RepID=A0A7C9ANM1_OPUST